MITGKWLMILGACLAIVGAWILGLEWGLNSGQIFVMALLFITSGVFIISTGFID